MILNIKVKPIQIVARTKDELMDKIESYNFYPMYGFSKNTINKVLWNSKTNKYRVYNLHKINAVIEQQKYKIGDKKGQTKKSVLVSPAKWVAYVYDFDSSLIKLMDIKLVQNTRNFQLLKNKK